MLLNTRPSVCNHSTNSKAITATGIIDDENCVLYKHYLNIVKQYS